MKKRLCGLLILLFALVICVGMGGCREGDSPWGNNVVTPMKNIEIRNCELIDPNPCKGIAIFLTSVTAPDVLQMEMSDIYIHDNTISEIGIWTHAVMWGNLGVAGTTPMKNWRIENNDIGIVQSNMTAFAVSGLICDDERIVGMIQSQNGDFDEMGSAYWISNLKGSAVFEVVEKNGNCCGRINATSDGTASLTQGIYLEAKTDYTAKLRVKHKAV